MGFEDVSLPNVDPQEVFAALDELLEIAERPAWHARAACRGVGTEVFFVGRGEPVEAALAYCGRCTVTSECLDSAGSSMIGIFGGASPRERQRIRKRQRGLIVSREAA